MTTRESEVLGLIKREPMISQEEIAAKLGITRSAVSVYVSGLMKKGYIKGRGYVVDHEDYTVVIGIAAVDIIGNVKDYRSDSALEHIFAQFGDISVSFGGAGRNIAEYLARLGKSVKLVAAISGDMFGRQLMQDCEELHIDTSACFRTMHSKQDMMVQLRDPTDHSRRSVLNYQMGEAITREFLQSQYGQLNAASRIVITDVLCRDAVEYLLCTFPRKEIWCIFSGVLKRLDAYRDLMGRFGCIYLNNKTADHYLERSVPGRPEEYAKELTSAGLKKVFVSCENRRMLYITPKQASAFVLPQDIITDSERGKDAFVAGLLDGTSQVRKSMKETVRLAAACSAVQLEAEQNGGATFGRDAVEARVEGIAADRTILY